MQEPPYLLIVTSFSLARTSGLEREQWQLRVLIPTLCGICLLGMLRKQWALTVPLP